MKQNCMLMYDLRPLFLSLAPHFASPSVLSKIHSIVEFHFFLYYQKHFFAAPFGLLHIVLTKYLWKNLILDNFYLEVKVLSIFMCSIRVFFTNCNYFEKQRLTWNVEDLNPYLMKESLHRAGPLILNVYRHLRNYGFERIILLLPKFVQGLKLAPKLWAKS